MLFINVPHPFSIVLKRFYCSQEVLSKIPKPIENNRKWVWWVYKRLWYSFVSAMFYNNNKLYHAICISLAIRHFKIYNDKPRQRFRSKRKKSSCKTKRINNFQSQRQSRHFHVFRTAWTRREKRELYVGPSSSSFTLDSARFQLCRFAFCYRVNRRKPWNAKNSNMANILI